MRISDWSSDVCSSDLSQAICRRPFSSPLLGRAELDLGVAFLLIADVPGAFRHEDQIAVAILGHVSAVERHQIPDRRVIAGNPARRELGRASGRESVGQYV